MQETDVEGSPRVDPAGAPAGAAVHAAVAERSGRATVEGAVGRGPADPPPATGRLTPRRALALLAVGSGLLTAVLAARGWFYYDDFWNLAVAHDLGWGWDLLGRPVFGHVAPGFNLFVGLVAGPGHHRYAVAAATLVLLAAAIPVAAAAAARALGARPWPSVAAGLVAMTAAPVATASTWWSGGLMIYPPMVAGMVVLAGFGAARRGARWGMPVAALALLGGLLFTEGAAVFLVPPVVLALADGPGGAWARVRAFLRDRRWLLLLVPLAVALVVRASASGPVDAPARPSLLSALTFPVAFVVKGFVPSFLGVVTNRFELAGSAGADAVAGLVLLALALVAGLRLRGRFPLAAVVAIVATVYARGVMIAWGRLRILGWHDAVEGRYYADLAWLVPVLLVARWPRAVVARRARPATGWRRAARGPVVALVAAVVLGLVGQAGVARNAPSVASGRYRDRLAASWRTVPAGTSTIDALVPSTVLGPQFGPFTFLSRTAGIGVASLRYAPADHWVAPDPSGRLVPVRLGPLSALVPSRAFTASGAPGVTHQAGCWVAGSQAALVWVPLTRGVTSGPWVLDLHLRGTSDGAVRFLTSGMGPATYLATSPVGRGDRRWVVAATPFQGTQIGVEIPAGGRFCLGSGSVSEWVATR